MDNLMFYVALGEIIGGISWLLLSLVPHVRRAVQAGGVALLLAGLVSLLSTQLHSGRLTSLAIALTVVAASLMIWAVWDSFSILLRRR